MNFIQFVSIVPIFGFFNSDFSRALRTREREFRQCSRGQNTITPHFHVDGKLVDVALMCGLRCQGFDYCGRFFICNRLYYVCLLDAEAAWNTEVPGNTSYNQCLCFDKTPGGPVSNQRLAEVVTAPGPDVTKSLVTGLDVSSESTENNPAVPPISGEGSSEGGDK